MVRLGALRASLTHNKTSPMDDKLEVIFSGADVHQALLVKNLLEQHDIGAYLDDEIPDGLVANTRQLLGGLAGVDVPAARVSVHAADVEAARQILRQAEASQKHGLSSPELAALESESDHDRIAWPKCPRCQRRRHTACPICETAGTDFVQAFLPDDQQIIKVIRRSDESDTEDEGHNLFLLCPTCDEPFVPRFLARCEWCGHRFNESWEPPEAIAPHNDSMDLNVRVLITLAGLIIAIAALFAFFANLASSN
jgi:hypothetical protein